MERYFVKWIINTIAIMLAIKYVPGILYTGEWWGVLVVGVLFGLINTFIRPFIKLFALPLLIFSLGLFTFVINAMMLSLTSWLSTSFISGSMWKVQGSVFRGSLISIAAWCFHASYLLEESHKLMAMLFYLIKDVKKVRCI
jgi:putative membrane protein